VKALEGCWKWSIRSDTHIHCLGTCHISGVADFWALGRRTNTAGPDADGIRRTMSAFAEHSLYLRGFDAFQGGVLHNARTQRP
jgi:hypothetical protein